MPTAKAVPGKALLNPTNHALILIDFQSQMAFATQSIDATALRNHAALISKAAKEFAVPTILTTVAEKSFSARCPTKSLMCSPSKKPSTALA